MCVHVRVLGLLRAGFLSAGQEGGPAKGDQLRKGVCTPVLPVVQWVGKPTHPAILQLSVGG